jgi:ornithine carbamoyltransferase
MADFMTIQEKKKKLKGLKLCYVGDGNNVAHSLMFAGARLGVSVTVACPSGYEPNETAVGQAIEDAKATGARIDIVHDPSEGVRNADIVYTDVWASMGQESEAEERRKIFLPYQVNTTLISRAKKDAIFMHCLPAHRGDEVTDEVIDSKQSVVFDEAENRLHAQKAIMYQLLEG